MKLLRLKITDHNGFRSLPPGFEYHFRTDWTRQEEAARVDEGFAPFVCAGPNGSGKSNLLEALAAIFFNVETRYLNFLPKRDADSEQELYLLSSESSSPDGYEIEYLIPFTMVTGPAAAKDAHVLITKEPGKSPELQWLNLTEFDGDLPEQTSRMQAKQLLPDFVLGYSSGENELLSLPFFKMRFVEFDEYIDFLRRGESYPGRPESRLAYLDTSFSQAIVIINWLFGTPEQVEPIFRDVKLKRLREFRIILKRRVVVGTPNLQTIAATSLSDPPAARDRFSINILLGLSAMDEKQRRNALIERLKRCATCFFEDEDAGDLYLDYFVNQATRDAFQANFDSAIELFQAFQILFSLNLYSVSEQLKQDVYSSDSHFVSETVPKLASDERVMRFKHVLFERTDGIQPATLKDLSDGEHQLLHSLGLCLLFKDKHCLFLLDEPETHFNPDWRANFISRLRECFDGAGGSREMLVTTHTPFLISDSRPEKVLVVGKDAESRTVSIHHPDYNTLGASINKITMSTFGKRETIGGLAQEILDGLRKRFNDGEDKEKLIAEINSQLGDSVEKMLLIKTILDSMEPKH